MFLWYVPTIYATTNTSRVMGGSDAQYDIPDIPRFLQKGRKHCFENPYLYCPYNRRCCTHISTKRVWCCDRDKKCGQIPMTCVVP